MEHNWAALPAVVLEEIFRKLSRKSRVNAARVCRHWFRGGFCSARLWHNLDYTARSFARRRRIYQGGGRTEIEFELSHNLLDSYISEFSALTRRIQISATGDFFNLYEFMNFVSSFIEFYEEEYPFPRLTVFSWDFASEIRGPQESSQIFGTGGKLLDACQRLLGNLKDLDEIHLSNLCLEPRDTNGFLLSAMRSSAHSCQLLELVNITMKPTIIWDVLSFTKLNHLILSNIHVSAKLLFLFGGSHLRRLTIVEDHKNEEFEPLASEDWARVRELNPDLTVTLETRPRLNRSVTLQGYAPVVQIRTLQRTVDLAQCRVHQVTELYAQSLRALILPGLPRCHQPRHFSLRCDSDLVLLALRCHCLETLVLRERVSTIALLLFVTLRPSTKRLYIRQNGILRRSRWPYPVPGISQIQMVQLSQIARSLPQTKAHIARQLKIPTWSWLPDKNFKQLKTDYAI